MLKSYQRKHAARGSFLSATFVLLAMCMLPGCRKESAPPDDTFSAPPNLRKYLGTYRIDPSYDGVTIALREDGSVSYSSGGLTSLAGSFTIDERILRVFLTLPDGERRRPLGVFLLSRFQPGGWPGMWDGETRNLIRIRGK